MPSNSEIVFLEFTDERRGKPRHYFMGTEQAILEATEYGTRYTGCHFLSRRRVSREDIVTLNLPFYRTGCHNILQCYSECAWLGTGENPADAIAA